MNRRELIKTLGALPLLNFPLWVEGQRLPVIYGTPSNWIVLDLIATGIAAKPALGSAMLLLDEQAIIMIKLNTYGGGFHWTPMAGHQLFTNGRKLRIDVSEGVCATVTLMCPQTGLIRRQTYVY